MKKTLTMFLAGLASVCYSQEPLKKKSLEEPFLQNRVKIAPMGFFVQAYSLGYERMLNRRLGFQFELGSDQNNGKFGRVNTTYFTPELRYYPLKFSNVAIYTGLNYTLAFIEGLNSQRIGVGTGSQFSFSKRFFIETGINYGRRWEESGDNQDHKQRISDANLNSGGSFNFNLGIGLKF